MYATDHIFLVLPIKYLINKDGKPTTIFKLATSMGTGRSTGACLIFYQGVPIDHDTHVKGPVS